MNTETCARCVYCGNGGASGVSSSYRSAPNSSSGGGATSSAPYQRTLSLTRAIHASCYIPFGRWPRALRAARHPRTHPSHRHRCLRCRDAHPSGRCHRQQQHRHERPLPRRPPALPCGGVRRATARPLAHCMGCHTMRLCNCGNTQRTRVSDSIRASDAAALPVCPPCSGASMIAAAIVRMSPSLWLHNNNPARALALLLLFALELFNQKTRRAMRRHHRVLSRRISEPTPVNLHSAQLPFSCAPHSSC